MKVQTFKVVLVGNPRVGKSNILTRFAYNKFDDQHKITIGVEFAQKTVTINEQDYKLAVWDTCGAEQYRALTKTYYCGAAGAFLVFDSTDRQSFADLNKWVTDIEQNAESVIVMLVANKMDLVDERQVTKAEAAQFAYNNNMAYIETSAKDGTGIQQGFEQLCQGILQNNEEIIKFANSNGDKKQANEDPKQNVKLSQHKVSKEEIKKNKQCC